MEMPQWQCHKKVRAFKIFAIVPHKDRDGSVLVPHDASCPSIDVSLRYVIKHAPVPGGYYVRYEDGYESFSPAEAFESGYTLINN